MSKSKIWNQSFISLISFNMLSDTDFVMDIESKKYVDAREVAFDTLEAFAGALESDKQKELIDIGDKITVADSIAFEDYFAAGLKMGMRLALEGFGKVGDVNAC
jgi:hypothetical protein